VPTDQSLSAQTSIGFDPQRLLRPRGVALVGVSGRERSLNSRPLAYLLEREFEGEIYPVNPGYTELQGVPCYPTLADVPGPVDLVLSMVPAAATADVVRQAGAIGAGFVVVFASGFAELGDEGSDLQRSLVEAARESGVRVLGPNCQGLLHAPTGLAATFSQAAAREAVPGAHVAYVGQSGAVGGSVLDLAGEMGLGLAVWAATGNQADLDLVDVASCVIQDEAVRVLMMYTEQTPDGVSYRRLAARTRELGKHLVVLVSGRSEAGRRAAASHTGSMLGDDAAFVLMSQEYGVTLVDDVDEMLAVAAVVDRAREVTGRRMGVVTTSGGAGSLAADHGALHDLAIPELTAGTQQALAELVPAFGSVTNPVDVTAQLFNREGAASALGQVCALVAADPEVDMVTVVLTMITGQLGADIARDLVSVAGRIDTPLFVVWLAGRDRTEEGRAVFKEAGIPVFASVGDVARTAGLIAPRHPDRPAATVEATPPHSGEATEVLEAALDGSASAGEVLDAVGIPWPRTDRVHTAPDAAAAAERLGAPVAMKIHAAGLDHKSDLGGVRLDVAPPDAAAVFDELLKIAQDAGLADAAVDVQRMIPAGVELIVGVTCGEDGYPPLVTVGIGGVTTEIYSDVTSALAPIAPAHAAALLRELRGWPLLDGFRGAPPADVEAVASAVSALSHAAAGIRGRAFEIEVNPLIASPHGIHAVDLLARTTTTKEH